MVKNILTAGLEVFTTVIVVFTCLFTASLGGSGATSAILTPTQASATEQLTKSVVTQPQESRKLRSARTEQARSSCKVSSNDKKKSMATLLLALGNPRAVMVACG
jgi:hypothetical protein